MNLFKIAFKVVRSNSKLIYKGFGFKHLSDGTQYYVHPDNQSYKGTTTLCQPIGEAIILFSSMLSSIINADKEKPFGDYWVSQNKDEYFLEIDIPEEYRENKVLEPEIYSYKAYLKGENITVAAYDKKVVLFGSEGNARTFMSKYSFDSADTQLWSKNNLPVAHTEVYDNIISIHKLEICAEVVVFLDFFVNVVYNKIV